MTLPHGFGSDRFNEPREPDKKCRLGKPCWRNRCTLHEWTWDHDEAYLSLKVIGCFVLFFSLLIIGIMIYDAQWEASHESIYRNIEGYNCKQLAEYVADKSESYSYAEHRYEWLCVNQQIKEFKG